MQDLDYWDLDSECLRKARSRPAGSLTPPAKCPPPHVQHLVSKRLQSILVARNCVVLVITANHRLEPLRGEFDGLMHTFSQLLPNILQLGRQPFADRLP